MNHSLLVKPEPSPDRRGRTLSFPPPVRLTVPTLMLVFGLLATWLDYWLALDVNLTRDLFKVRERAEKVAERIAATSEPLLANGLLQVSRLNLTTLLDVPELVIAGLVDDRGLVIADSQNRWIGRPVLNTPLATVASLVRPTREIVVQAGDNGGIIYSACPFSLPNGRYGWVLVELDRRPAIAEAEADARLQFYWTSGAMALLSFGLWALLHFVYTNRLNRLAKNIQGWEAGNWDTQSLPKGGDEVAWLAEDFTDMATRLREQESEQLRLEREVLNITEQERQRIGHDLHDSLGQRLTAASMAANALLQSVQDSAPALRTHGELVAGQLREAILEVRALSHGLAPVAMNAEGLMTALTEMASSVSRSGQVRCVLDCPEPVAVDKVEVGTQVFRIAQEAVNNALKHASPSEIRIGLEQREGRLLLEVEDDGTGIDETAPPSEGLGMRVMRYRARLIGGTLETTASPAGGTLVRCLVPISPVS